MKKTIYKVGAFLSSSALLVSSLSPAVFGDNSATNTGTGALSTNITEIENKNNVVVSNVNDAHIVNEVKTVSDTGGNSASYNTMGGSVQTGNAISDTSISNVANYNTTKVALGNWAADNEVENSKTGYDSFNKAEVENKNSVKVWNDNTAWITNNVTADSRTGGNRASYNTGAGDIMTGSALSEVDVVNHINDSATEVIGLGGWGSNSVVNAMTGALSKNIGEIENENKVEVSNVNDAAVMNRVIANANTGRNRASYNTSGGFVDTGNAKVDVDLDTTANYNTTKVALAQSLGFTNEAGSFVSGYDSFNKSELENENSFMVYNWNNKGLSKDAPDYCKEGRPLLDSNLEFERRCWGVYNYDFDSAFSGHNTTSYNTGFDDVITGMAGVFKTVKVWLNDSFTAVN